MPDTGDLKQEQLVKEFANTGKKKASVRKETNAVSGMRVTIVHKNPEHNAATPSEPSFSRGRSVSKKTSIRGKRNHGSILRQPCRYYFVGTCTRTSCEYCHPPECQFHKTYRDTRQEVSVCSRIRRKRATIPKKRRESDDKNAVAIAKIAPQLGCVSQDPDVLVSQRGKQSPGNPMQKVLGSIRKVRFTQSTLRQASIWEKKGPSLGELQVKNLHRRSPYAVKFEDRSHEETERQQRCARSKAWNLVKNILQALRERQKLHSSRPRKNGYSRLRQQKSRRKESLRWIPESVCIWSSSETLTLLSWRP